MVLMPIFGDQFHNSYVAKDKGVAEVLRYNDLDEQSLTRALNNVFNNTRYAASLSVII
jgi:UDP:flavonoid glycosyltransferase YjiC (YdhE family)